MSDWKNVQYKDGKYRTGEGGGGGSSTFAGLDDVSFSNIQNGQVPKYNSNTQKWENADESGGGGTVTDVQVDGVSVVNQQGVAEIEMPIPPSVPDKLSDLSDVQFSNLTDHQPLRYNATSQKWENGADSFPPLIYSNEEREVGVWRDGKPLYQKTINVGELPATPNVTKYTNHNISDLGDVASVYGLAKNSSGTRLLLPNPSPTSSYVIQVSVNNTQIGILTGTDRSSFSGYVTLQYTKTTDTAGSGTWTTQGGYAHHYSTTEHVIGTWIDGKPLYEKTVYFGSLSSGAQTVTMGLSNPNVIVDISIRAQVPSGAWCVLPMVYLNSTTTSQYGAMADGYNASTDKVTINIGSSRSFTSGYIIIQYTKTTD